MDKKVFLVTLCICHRIESCTITVQYFRQKLAKILSNDTHTEIVNIPTTTVISFMVQTTEM